MTMHLPMITPDNFFELASNWDKRKEWDNIHYVDPEIIEKTRNGSYDTCLLYHKSKKAPVPFNLFVAQRDILVKYFSVKNAFKRGQHIIAGVNATDDRKPIDTGYFADVRAGVNVHGFIIEPNTDWERATGTKIVEIRSMNINGSIPGELISKVADEIPYETIKIWIDTINDINS